jgi:hypothetical protein
VSARGLTFASSQSDVDSVTVQGFFNGVPGDSAVLDNAKVMEGYNLVSSGWTESKRFTLHQAPPKSTPQLHLPNGEIIVCRGYISGTWTDHDLKMSWVGLKLFVVDAIFAVRGFDQQHHFLFGPGALKKMNQHQCMWHLDFSKYLRLTLSKQYPTVKGASCVVH